MGMTMYFWSERIQTLNTLTFKQQFIEKYQGLYMNSLSSSYIDWKKYEKINIYIAPGFTYSTDAWTKDLLDFTDYYYTWISMDDKPVNGLKVEFMPYKLKCNLYANIDGSATWSNVKFAISNKKWKTSRCFTIINSNCKLVEYRCE